jgi:hypothetical protein
MKHFMPDIVYFPHRWNWSPEKNQFKKKTHIFCKTSLQPVFTVQDADPTMGLYRRPNQHFSVKKVQKNFVEFHAT